MVETTFKNCFWETDFVTQHGFDAIISRMKDGQKTCRWLEDFFKQRAKAEEDYAKALLKISKLERNGSEFGTLKKTIEEFRAEAEVEASLHLTVASKIAEQSSKLTEFREKQRDDRKKNEDIVHKSHRNKSDLYKKMITLKNSYENKSKAAEKAENDADKVSYSLKPKDVEKARKHAVQCRTSATKADEDYKNSVTSVEQGRVSWVKDHCEACDVLQDIEEERIQVLRNEIWVFSNLVSDICCRLDDSRERIRVITEMCDHKSDVKEFIRKKATCSSPLQEVKYIPFGGKETNNNVADTSLRVNGESYYEAAGNIVGHAPVLSNTVYTAIYDYTSASNDELELQTGDQLTLVDDLSHSDTGWLNGKNSRTNLIGLFPQNYVEEVKYY